ncbi:MAG: glucose 1-dehydrogenase [Firmicutes bacterium]|nr:glucose 1-dehydrogenase [Bacillota bacterium]
MKLGEMFNLSNKVAVVTGGSVGLGAQMAAGLAEAGANLVIAARKVDRCLNTCSELEKEYGVSTLPAACDVSKAEDCERLINEAVGRFGRIDILVNNAGATWGADSLDFPMDRWSRVIDINLTGLYRLSMLVARKMKEQGGGKIINITSLAGFMGTPPEIQNTVPYNASKGAVITLTKDLAVKWARYGINVNAIAPGYFPTDMSSGLLKKTIDLVMPRIPLNRLGSDHDLKGAVVFLSSAASDYITGQCLVVDGGMMAGG